MQLSNHMLERRNRAMGMGKPVEEKKPYSIPRVSAKRQKVNRQYKKQVVKAHKEDNRCKVKSPVCTFFSQGFHHPQKKTPGNLMKEENQIPCCNACNLYIEENSRWAFDNGFTISKFKK